MKQIIKIYDKFGAELHTRKMMEKLKASLVEGDEYLLDFENIEQISRSAADELYEITHSSQKVEVINMTPFVQKMYDAVTLGRFLPRNLTHSSTPIVHCETLEKVSQCLLAN